MWVFCLNSVIWGFCRRGYCRWGFCRWRFCRRGFCHVGFLSWISLQQLSSLNKSNANPKKKTETEKKFTKWHYVRLECGNKYLTWVVYYTGWTLFIGLAVLWLNRNNTSISGFCVRFAFCVYTPALVYIYIYIYIQVSSLESYE